MCVRSRQLSKLLCVLALVGAAFAHLSACRRSQQIAPTSPPLSSQPTDSERSDRQSSGRQSSGKPASDNDFAGQRSSAASETQTETPKTATAQPGIAQPTGATGGTQATGGILPTTASGGGADVAQAPMVSERRKGFFDHGRKEHRGIVLGGSTAGAGGVAGCAACHARDAAQPRDVKLNQPGRNTATWLPFHDACASCHVKESFQQTAPDTLAKNPFCVVCHTGGITAENRALLVRYPARLQEFGLEGIAGERTGFSHRTHMDAAKMGASATPNGNQDAKLAKCSTCHQFDARGVRGTFPGHATCFQCHAHQATQPQSNCDVCHIVTAQAVSFVRGPEAAFKFFRFRHSPAHLRAASCDRCHRTLEPTQARQLDIQKISTGQGKRHTSACWSCHQQAKEPVCTKCHTVVPTR